MVHRNTNRYGVFVWSILLIFVCLFSVTTDVFGQTADNAATSTAIDELKSKIDDRTSKIRELENEIDKYQSELEDVGKEKTSLQGAIKTLDISTQKIETQKNLTENKISQTTFEISKLTLEIQDQERKIDLHNQTLAESIREINRLDESTFIETMLASTDFSDIWNQVDNLERFEQGIQTNLRELEQLKADLEASRDDQQTHKDQLVDYTNDLADQAQGLAITKQEKSTLLEKTKNKESNYITLIEEKKAARAEFEQELVDFQSQLKTIIDPTSIPEPNHGILAWPLASIRITQYFGDTEFAKTGAYDGKGHNGVDLAASIGTPVKAALSGVVTATGNTDAIAGCYSYGKWMLIKHPNGLSTLYAHLSHIGAGEGANVETGQTIGYSGDTGYATGPHLHFTVFATQGVQIVRMGDIKKVTNCGDAHVPVAPLAAYLDPISYLPEL